jgi:microcystin degradation protein MlrC
MWSMRKDFQFRLYSIEEALEEGSRSVKKPVLLDELPDCTLGGSSGDVVASLRCMINAGVKDSVAVGIVDPEAVSAAVKAGVGAAVRLMIGGKVCTQDNPPLEFAGKVKKIGKNVGGDSTIHAGYETKVGNVAVLEGSGIEVVLIEYPGKIGGPTFLEKVGIDPRAKQFILTKEGLNCLVEYRDIAGQILMVNSPGFNRQILRARDYKNIRRPIYPIDPDMTWSP